MQNFNIVKTSLCTGRLPSRFHCVYRQTEDEGFFIPGREPPDGDRGGCRDVPVRRVPRRCYHRPHQHADRHDEPLLRGYPGTNTQSL